MTGIEAFSERRFPGYAVWLGRFWLIAASGGLLTLFAYPRIDGRLLDPTRLLVIGPLSALLFVALIVWILSVALRVSIKSSLQALTSWLWLLWLPGVIDWVLRLIGVAAERPLVLPWQVAVGFITAGFLPSPLASIGTLIGLIVSVWWTYRTVKSLAHDQRRSVLSAAAVYVSGLLIVSLPSLLARWGVTGSTLLLGPLGLKRGLVALANGGYWWGSVYERFAFALGGEADVAVQYFLGALVFLALAILVLTLALKTLAPRWRSWPTLVRNREFALPFVLVFFGAALAWSQGARPVWNFSTWVALLVFIFAIFSAWLFATAQNDLQDVATDELTAPDKPFISGTIKINDWQEVGVLFLLVALVGAWFLGWPVFVGLGAFLAIRFIYDHPGLPFKNFFPVNNLLLGAADLALVIAGWYWVGQQASLSKFPNGLALGLFLGLAALAVLKDVKDQANAQKVLQLGAVASLAGYLLPALLSGWWRWLLLAVPLAGASAFFVFLKPYSERWPRLLIRLYFLLSGLLLVSGWLVSRKIS